MHGLRFIFTCKRFSWKFQIIRTDKEILNGECNRTYIINEGDQIDILATKKSAYGYMALQGGFNIKTFCRSVSVLSRAEIGPNEGKKIKIKDKINIKIESNDKKDFLTNVAVKSKKKIRVLKGPQYDYFSKESQKEFFLKEYKISNLTDRMGMRLEGTVMKNIISTNIRSEGITKGAIQVPADGQPIVLLTDYPTIGGYPKIATVIINDYNKLVQMKPETEFYFKETTIKEAENLYKQYIKKISMYHNK